MCNAKANREESIRSISEIGGSRRELQASSPSLCHYSAYLTVGQVGGAIQTFTFYEVLVGDAAQQTVSDGCVSRGVCRYGVGPVASATVSLMYPPWIESPLRGSWQLDVCLDDAKLSG